MLLYLGDSVNGIVRQSDAIRKTRVAERLGCLTPGAVSAIVSGQQITNAGRDRSRIEKFTESGIDPDSDSDPDPEFCHFSDLIHSRALRARILYR